MAPETAEVSVFLAAGHEALRSGQWAEAKKSFGAALAQQQSADALAGLGDAPWWLGETADSIRYAEQAYTAYRKQPNPICAALAAMHLYFVYRVSVGNTAASRGWMGRLARVVEEFDLAPLAGWVSLIRAHDTDDPAAGERWAREACELARRFADTDLELCALSQLGAALVRLGRTEEGTALLDEAMAGALAGECNRLNTVVYACCNMIRSCAEIAELQRATQWIRAADGFTRRYGCPHVYTTCRTDHGSVLFATGDWVGAEHELTAALSVGKTAERALYGEALARLAELRLAQGRLEEAQRLLVGFEEHFTSATVVAAISLARGDAAAAIRIVHRRLREIEQYGRDRPGPYRPGAAGRLEQARLLELLAEAAVDQNDPQEADATARRLATLAQSRGYELITARSARARALAMMVNDDHIAAIDQLEFALSCFARLTMPFEAARTRLMLAAALREHDEPAAVAEAQSAAHAFEALGAARHADQAAALLRSLGVRMARRGPGDSGALTSREREVLELLAQGLSNRELAERLFLTRKTIEHHVRNVLAKLGLRSRAEAAAYAVRHLDRDS